MTMIKITGQLAAHFSADEIPSEQVRDTYAATMRVLDNFEKFPKADFETLHWLEDALFNLSPLAAMEGI